jgi:hypothetical protein
MCFDSTLNLAELPAGDYTLALTKFANFAVGPTLGDGWSGGAGGSFGDRTARYAVDVQAIPEPMTFGLIGSGLLLLGFLRRRAR